MHRLKIRASLKLLQLDPGQLFRQQHWPDCTGGLRAGPEKGTSKKLQRDKGFFWTMFSQIQWWCTGWKGQRSSAYSEEMNDQCIPLQSPRSGRSDQEWQVFTPLCRQSSCLTNRFLLLSTSSLHVVLHPFSFKLNSQSLIKPSKVIAAFLKTLALN